MMAYAKGRLAEVERELADAHGIAQALEQRYIEQQARLATLTAALGEARDEIQYLCIHKHKDRLDCRQCVLLHTIDTALDAARGTT